MWGSGASPSWRLGVGQLVCVCSRCSSLVGGTNLQGPSKSRDVRFGITYRSNAKMKQYHNLLWGQHQNHLSYCGWYLNNVQHHNMEAQSIDLEIHPCIWIDLRLAWSATDHVAGLLWWWCRDEGSGVTEPGKLQGDKCRSAVLKATDQPDLLGTARLQGDPPSCPATSRNILTQSQRHTPPEIVNLYKNQKPLRRHDKGLVMYRDINLCRQCLILVLMFRRKRKEKILHRYKFVQTRTLTLFCKQGGRGRDFATTIVASIPPTHSFPRIPSASPTTSCPEDLNDLKDCRV